VFMVTAAFSLAASVYFPALVMGIFWKRASAWGAIAGMWAGFVVTLYYMVTNQPWLRAVFSVESPITLWWDIQPLAAGVFGVPAGLGVLILVSWLCPAPSAESKVFVDHIRSGV
jgi:cation/acetate symporter